MASARKEQNPPTSERRRRAPVALILILVIAAALRLWGLGAKSLWLDEIMTVEKASMSYAGMIDEIRGHDAHPPLFQTIEWLFLRVGRSDAWARLPSALAGIAGVWLASLIARRLFSRRAGTVAAILMALSYFHIYYSQEARLYALITTLFLAQTYVLLVLIGKRGSAGWGGWAGYGLLALASLYTYVLSILFIGALGALYLWLTWRRQPQFAPLIVVHVIVAMLFLPWLPVLRQRTDLLRVSIQQNADAAGRPTLGDLTTGAASWAFGPADWDKVAPAGPLLGICVSVAAGGGLLMRRSRRPAKVLGALFVLPLVGYLILPMPRVQAYDPKHLAFLQPVLVLALAGFAFRTPRFRPRTAVRPLLYTVLAVAAVNAFALGDYFHPDFQKEDWRGLYGDVAPRLQADDALVFNPGYVGFAFAFHSNTPEAKAAIRKRAERGVSPGADVARLWLIECRSPVSFPSARVAERLHAAGWQWEERARYPGALGYVRWALLTRGKVEGPQP